MASFAISANVYAGRSEFREVWSRLEISGKAFALGGLVLSRLSYGTRLHSSYEKSEV